MNLKSTNVVLSKLIVISILSVLNFMTLVSQECECSQNMKELIGLVEKNYSGFPVKINAKTRNKYIEYTDAILVKSQNAASDEMCKLLMSKWLGLFKDGHLWVEINPQTSGYVNTYGQYLKNQFCIKEIDKNCLLINLPSFAGLYGNIIDSLVAENYLKILTKPYLIIDVRNNGGGSDRSWGSLFNILYSRPVKRDKTEIRVSEQNARACESYGKEDLAYKLRSSKKEFEVWYPESKTKLSHSLIYPKKIFVLQNEGCASSCESLLEVAKQSDKVVTIGSNSAGILDYSNVTSVLLGGEKFVLHYPITKRSGNPNRGIDNIGIEPDIKYITSDILEYTIKLIEADSLKSPLAKDPGIVLTKEDFNFIYHWETAKHIDKVSDNDFSSIDKIENALKYVPENNANGLHPQLAGMYYKMALLYLEKGELKSVSFYLKKAIDHGFADYELVEKCSKLKQVSGFDSIGSQIISIQKAYNQKVEVLRQGKPLFSKSKIPASRKSEIIKSLRLDSIIGNGEFAQKINLMKWVHSLKRIDVSLFQKVNPEGVELFDGIIKEESLLSLPIFLNELYLSLGYQSRFVLCTSENLNLQYCFTSVYSDSLNKWICVDPILGNFTTDSLGTALSFSELRGKIFNREHFEIIGRMDFKGQNLSVEDYKRYVGESMFACVSPKEPYLKKNNSFISYFPCGYSFAKKDYEKLFSSIIKRNPKFLFTSNFEAYWN